MAGGRTYLHFTFASYIFSYMFFKYLLVFLGAMAVDIVPFPFPPAFTVMIFLQIKFHLAIWLVILIGVAGSIAGRYILTLYIPLLSGKIFKPAKNEDVKYLGDKLASKGWKSQLSILVYSLLPLPTTPLFLAAGMAKMKPYYIIPAFTVGKVISDTVAVTMGKYAAENSAELLHGMVSWKSITGLAVGILLLFALLFIDWRTLLQQKKLSLKFRIWN
jgi:membrane protein DedA with SNARE-associated domain